MIAFLKGHVMQDPSNTHILLGHVGMWRSLLSLINANCNNRQKEVKKKLNSLNLSTSIKKNIKMELDKIN